VTASAEPGADQDSHLRVELIRLRKQLHRTACELTKSREQLELAQRELHTTRSENDELRLKYSNLERTAKTTGAQLLEERCKSDELSKQVKAMSQNLMSIMGQQESSDRAKDATGLQKRCFKLVQQNTALTVQSRLLRRQKGWAEAKARVLQDEVTRIYLGTHDQVKSASELEESVSREFSQHEMAVATGQGPSDGAQICKLLIPAQYKHKEAVIDFLTHITHTCGNDVIGFLQSTRVFSEAIRNECLSGLGREYYAHVRLIRQVPLVLRAAERLVHLGQYLDAFEGFAKELSELLGCAHAKLWVVDHLRQVLWTCVRVGEEPHTHDLAIPKSRDADLAGSGLAVAACVSQKVISAADVAKDPRHNPHADSVSGRVAKSMLCVPVVHKGRVRVVLQAANKLAEPDFDSESDARVLRLLGRVSMEVLQVCEANSTQSAFTKRKDSLLQLFNDFVPCQTSMQLAHAVETGLRELFHSEAAVVHAVQHRDRPLEQQRTTVLQAGAHKERQAGRRGSIIMPKVKTPGLRGIVGNVVRSMNHYTYSHTQVLAGSTPHSPDVDLAVPSKGVLHTVPLVDPDGVAAVLQFVCPERERTIVGDDGTFRPDNMQHMRLLSILLKFVLKHLDIVAHTSSTDSSQAQPQAQPQAAPPVVNQTRGQRADAGSSLCSSSDTESEEDEENGEEQEVGPSMAGGPG